MVQFTDCMCCSRDLDRLAKLLTSRQKEQKGRRESWSAQSSQDIWRQLVAETKRAGRDHAAMAEIYSTAITARCTQLNDDISRIYKKVRAGSPGMVACLQASSSVAEPVGASTFWSVPV